MVAFFSSLQKTVGAGVVIAIALIIIMGLASGHWISVGDKLWWAFFLRWLHILSGVMWIGLLWYFNFVQTPMVPKIEPVEHRAAVSKFIAPQALWWFRYGALATVVTGLLLAWLNDYIVDALALRSNARAIGIGMWLALIMAFNVWFIIWPNQKKILGFVEASADEKAVAARWASVASRVNTMLSIPMLYCMAAQSHGGFV
jgi:uncharacterized membrane protein